MSNPIDKAGDTVKRNVDLKTMWSVVAGIAVSGVITYVAIRSGIKPLAKVAKVAGAK